MSALGIMGVQGGVWYDRGEMEVMYICVNNPSLNRHLGKYQLLHIWNKVLQETPALQLK